MNEESPSSTLGTWIAQPRGNLFFLNFEDLPFKPQRFFVVSYVPEGESRGSHAHYECEQLLVCIRGHIEIIVDMGNSRQHHVLNPGDTLFHGKMEWAELKYYDDGELLSICSTPYDADDYITDYDTFLKLANANEE